VIALAIGVFDGVHVGHQALLRRATETAAELGCKSGVLTFHPHPACVVAPDRAPRLLYSIEERRELLRGYSIEDVRVLKFDAGTAALTPEQFAAIHLSDVRAVVVGEDFRFGKGRAGDVSSLAGLGFDVRPVAAVRVRGLVVSSSEIRKRVEGGEVSLAGRLLGRAYAVSGPIVAGHGIGSKQTVPTLNLQTDAEVLPANGVYITRTTDLATNHHWNSITNVGVRPTFENAGRLSTETFLLGELNGAPPENIRLQFLRRVRAERKFDSPEALRAQIFRDVAVARGYFRRLNW
jgi:riboflavin kinase/FMN adenylyltransferase